MTFISLSDVFLKLLKSSYYLILLLLNTILLFPVNQIIRSRRIYILVFNGLGIGDALAFTSFINFETKENNSRFVVISYYPDVFKNLHGVCRNIHLGNHPIRFIVEWIESSIHSNIISCYGGNVYFLRESPLYHDKYSYYGNILRTKKLYLMHVFLYPRRSLYKKVLRIDLKPIIRLTEEEIHLFEKKYTTLLNKRFALVMSGSSCKIKSKNIGFEKLRDVVEYANKRILVIQVGTTDEKPLLDGQWDFRGDTTLRELFYLASKAKFCITNEGLLTHVCGAFATPCITFYTGYHYKEISLYKTTIPVVPSTLPSCAYCFLEECPHSDNSSTTVCANKIDTGRATNIVDTLAGITSV